MRIIRILLSMCLLSLSTIAFAQHDEAHKASVSTVSPEAKASFTTIKNLAGEWEGPVAVAEMPSMHSLMHASLRVTSRGNVLVHEFQEAATPLDATKYDHPVTMFYLDGDDLTLVHYCDAGNRPRMIGKMTPDGKTVEFELKDISGSTKNHMHHAVFTTIDDGHHLEDWTFMMGDKPMHAHFDLHRVK